mmetsp:Transcript_107691/g.291931  ORF Transcript_107691/g.291931 Transcript_107691/m.291931 type:complete len:131 (+) Transcript_107691:2-394(+)
MVPPQWFILSELAECCPRMAGVAAYAASPERSLQRDHPIKPYPVALGEEERERLLKQGGTVPTDSKQAAFALAMPGDEMHPVYPGGSGRRHRITVVGQLGRLASFELQRDGPFELPLREATQGWYTLAKL